jgi:hypothetical protein
MREIPFILAILCLVVAACGGGDITIDRTKGDSSVAGNSLAYFTNTIFPLMIQDRTDFVGGCAGATACHFKGSAAETAQTFFQVNPSSKDDSALWAQVRRSSVITGSYAATNSITLTDRMSSNHNAFATWTAAEKAKITYWAGLAD